MKDNIDVFEFLVEHNKDLYLNSGAKDEIFVDFDGMICYLLSNSSFRTETLKEENEIPFLQFIFVLEQFLLKLKEKNLSVRVVFFQMFERMWCSAIIRVLRNVVKEHLKSSMKIPLDEFDSPLSNRFENYLKKRRPFLFFASNEKLEIPQFVSNSKYEELLMIQIIQFSSSSFPIDVVTFNSLEFGSNAINGFVWCPKEELSGSLENYKEEIKKEIDCSSKPIENTDMMSLLKKYLIDPKDKDTESFGMFDESYIPIFALACAFLMNKKESRKGLWENTQLLLLCCLVKESVSIHDRSFSFDGEMEKKEANEFLGDVFGVVDLLMKEVMQMKVQKKRMIVDIQINEWIDCFDPRLFFLLKQLYNQGKISLEKVILEKFFTNELNDQKMIKALSKKEEAKESSLKQQRKDDEGKKNLFGDLPVIKHVIVDEIFKDFVRLNKEVDGKKIEDALSKKEKAFEEKYKWDLSTIGEEKEEEQSIYKNEQLKYNQKIQSIQRYADSLTNKSERKIFSLSLNANQQLPQEEGKKNNKDEEEKNQRRGKGKGKRKNKKGGKAQRQLKLAEDEEDMCKKDAIILNNRANENLRKLEIVEKMKEIVKKNPNLDNVNEMLSLCLELYIERELDIENLLVFCYLRRIELYLKTTTEQNEEMFKWRIFQTVLNLYRVFVKMREKREKKVKEELSTKNEELQTTGKKGGKKKNKKKKNKKKKNKKAAKNVVGTNYVKLLEKKIEELVVFKEENILKTIGKVLQRIGLEEKDFVEFQLKYRERYQSFGENSELSKLEDYWNTEEYYRYKKVHGFIPDEWQKEMMSSFEKDESLLVVTPTSSGKTYMTFLLMEKILKESDDGVLVFVSPTTALVNQVAAEVLSRYGKNYKNEQMKVVGVYTNADRITPLNCQILVTVPNCFQSLLMSPKYSNMEWKKRIRYVIFDEIHTINDFEGGEIWEQLLLMIDCPFLALSATIGNPQEFVRWLNTGKGGNVKLIENYERPNDLVYQLFDPREKNASRRIMEIHPCSLLNENAATLREAEYEIQHIKQMTPNQCFLLYEQFLKNEVMNEEEKEKLLPHHFFYESRTRLIPKLQVRSFEKELKNILLRTREEKAEAYKKIIRSLRGNLENHVVQVNEKKEKEIENDIKEEEEEEGEEEDLEKKEEYTLKEALPRLCESLKSRRNFPCLVFHFSKEMVEKLAIYLYSYLDDNKQSLFDSESEKGSFEEVIDEVIEFLKKQPRGGDSIFHACLKYSIGIHHGSIDKSYRSEVERLFRQRKLKVMITTGTLSLGINMPCKSVCLFGDSVYLTSTLFNQTSGRAGRRGFDTQGEVILFGLSWNRMKRLMVKENECITGKMNISTSLILKFLILLKKNKNFVGEVKRILSTPLSLLEHSSAVSSKYDDDERQKHSKEKVMFKVLFSLQFLLDQGYINNLGDVGQFAEMVNEMSFMEPENFLFVRFLESGILHELGCEEEDEEEKTNEEENEEEMEEWEKEIIEEKKVNKEELEKRMMNLICSMMTNLFRSSRGTNKEKILPPSSNAISREIEKFKMEITNCLKRFVWNFFTLHKSDELPPSHLPLSLKDFGNVKENESLSKFDSIRKEINNYSKKVLLVSPFSGLSGRCDDDFPEMNLKELFECLRSDLHVDPSLLPLPRWIFNENLEVSSCYLDFAYSIPNIKQLCLAHPFSRQELEYNFGQFFKNLRKLNGVLHECGPSSDSVVKVLKDIGMIFMKNFYSRKMKRRQRRQGRLRVSKMSTDVGDHIFDENGNYSAIDVPVEFLNQQEEKQKMKIKNADLPFFSLDKNRLKTKNKRGGNMD